MTWIRFGLASVILAGGAGGVLAVGCGGDDTGPTASPDAGKDGTTVDTGLPDTSPGSDTGTDAGPKPAHAKILVVNASPDFGPMRFCFATSTNGTTFTVPPLAALPHTGVVAKALPFPGLPPGAGGPLPDLEDLATTTIRGFLIKASVIAGDNANPGTDAAAERTCDKLIGKADGSGGGALTPNVDFFQMNDIPAGTFAHGTTELVAAVGCLPAAQDDGGPFNGGAPVADAVHCGTGYKSDVGNLSVKYYTLDTSIPSGTTFGAQVIHLSSAADGLGALKAGGPVVQNTGFLGVVDGGPGVLDILTTGQTYQTQLPADGGKTEPGTILADQLHNAFFVQTYNPAPPPDAGNADGGEGGAPFNPVVGELPEPLGLLTYLSTGQLNDAGLPVGADGGPYLLPGESYTFVILGDPDPRVQQLYTVDPDSGAPVINPAFSGFGLHVIAFPNHITPPKFQ